MQSHALAHTALPEVWVPDPQTRDDRALLRARVDTAEKAGSIKAEIRCVLKLNSLVAPSEVGDKWGLACREWLRTVGLRLGARNGLDSPMRQLGCLDKDVVSLDPAINAYGSLRRNQMAKR